MNKIDQLSLSDWLRAKARDRVGRDYYFDEFDAAKTAFVVVDMQNYFMKPGFQAACPMAIETVPQVNRMAQIIREKGGTVVWIQTTAEPEATVDWGVYQNFYSAENWNRRDTELAEDHEGYEIWSGLEVAEDDLIIKKTRFSAFIKGSSDIDAQMKARGIDTLLVGGVATNVCCEATARDAMMLNYRVTMVEDCLGAMSQEAHDNALKAVYGMFADVQSVDEIAEKLSA